MASRSIFPNTVRVSHLGQTVVTIFLVAIVMSQPLVVSKVMTLLQVALVISLFLPSIMAFLVTEALLYSWFALPVFPTAGVIFCYVVSEGMVTVTPSLVSDISPLHSVSLILVFVKAKLRPSAVILVVVLVFYLAMHRGTPQ